MACRDRYFFQFSSKPVFDVWIKELNSMYPLGQIRDGFRDVGVFSASFYEVGSLLLNTDGMGVNANGSRSDL